MTHRGIQFTTAHHALDGVADRDIERLPAIRPAPRRGLHLVVGGAADPVRSLQGGLALLQVGDLLLQRFGTCLRSVELAADALWFGIDRAALWSSDWAKVSGLAAATATLLLLSLWAGRVTCAHFPAIAGTSVAAVAPEPITTTRLPARSRFSGQFCG